MSYHNERDDLLMLKTASLRKLVSKYNKAVRASLMSSKKPGWSDRDILMNVIEKNYNWERRATGASVKRRGAKYEMEFTLHLDPSDHLTIGGLTGQKGLRQAKVAPEGGTRRGEVGRIGTSGDTAEEIEPFGGHGAREHTAEEWGFKFREVKAEGARGVKGYEEGVMMIDPMRQGAELEGEEIPASEFFYIQPTPLLRTMGAGAVAEYQYQKYDVPYPGGVEPTTEEKEEYERAMAEKEEWEERGLGEQHFKAGKWTYGRHELYGTLGVKEYEGAEAEAQEGRIEAYREYRAALRDWEEEQEGARPTDPSLGYEPPPMRLPEPLAEPIADPVAGAPADAPEDPTREELSSKYTGMAKLLEAGVKAREGLETIPEVEPTIDPYEAKVQPALRERDIAEAEEVRPKRLEDLRELQEIVRKDLEWKRILELAPAGKTGLRRIAGSYGGAAGGITVLGQVSRSGGAGLKYLLGEAQHGRIRIDAIQEALTSLWKLQALRHGINPAQYVAEKTYEMEHDPQYKRLMERVKADWEIEEGIWREKHIKDKKDAYYFHLLHAIEQERRRVRGGKTKGVFSRSYLEMIGSVPVGDIDPETATTEQLAEAEKHMEDLRKLERIRYKKVGKRLGGVAREWIKRQVKYEGEELEEERYGGVGLMMGYRRQSVKELGLRGTGLQAQPPPGGWKLIPAGMPGAGQPERGSEGFFPLPDLPPYAHTILEERYKRDEPRFFKQSYMEKMLKTKKWTKEKYDKVVRQNEARKVKIRRMRKAKKAREKQIQRTKTARIRALPRK